MIFEFIATLAAGFGLAGVALVIRHLAGMFKIKTPKWLVPLFAAIGIVSFQIHQEYNWYAQTVAKLPKHVKVVKEVPVTSWYKPWSYISPQVVRFMAIDTDRVQANTQSAHIKKISLYLFERRMSTKVMPQLIDCQTKQRADFYQSNMQKSMSKKHNNWYDLAVNDPLLQTVCNQT